MISHFGETFAEDTIQDQCLYSDYWFLEDSSILNPELAVMSSIVDGTSYSNTEDGEGGRINALMQAMGYADIRLNTYFSENLTLENSIGAIVGKKAIKDYDGNPYTLVALFPRNAGYRDEWVGNFNVGVDGIHKGFLEIRDELLRFLKKYITESNVTGSIKLWAAGYSRGAAATNLLGGYLDDNPKYLGENISLKSKDLFVYTIGTPNPIPSGLAKSSVLSVAGPRGESYKDTDIPAYAYEGEAGTVDPSDASYQNIHNFVAVGDYITKLPSPEWGFTRYGVTEKVVYGDEHMREFLNYYSKETADGFVDKNFATEVPGKTFDLKTFNLVDTEKRQSADAIIAERLGALMSIVNGRQGLIESGCDKVLGALAGIFGDDLQGFMDSVQANIPTAIKAGAFTYLSAAQEKTELSDAKVFEEIIAQFFGKKPGEDKAYTDVDFLEDLLDFLVNDYQTDVRTLPRLAMLSSLIPAPYGELYKKLVDYAKQNKIIVKTADALIELLCKFITDNRAQDDVDELLGVLAGLIPENYASMIPGMTGKEYDPEIYPDQRSVTKAALGDLLEIFVKGREDLPNMTPAQLRYSLLGLVVAFALPGATNIQNLFTRGMVDSDGKVVEHEAVSLDLIAEEVLNLAMPKDEEGKRITIEEMAERSIVELLEKCRTDHNGKYMDVLIGQTDLLRQALVEVLFNPGAEYDLVQDIENAVTFIETMKFVFPAHSHEMYVAYLKSKVQA